MATYKTCDGCSRKLNNGEPAETVYKSDEIDGNSGAYFEVKVKNPAYTGYGQTKEYLNVALDVRNYKDNAHGFSQWCKLCILSIIEHGKFAEPEKEEN